jgi:aromatic ring hydroxylase
MLRAGNDYLESLRDGRRVYVGSELVRDVTSHPAFRRRAVPDAADASVLTNPDLRETFDTNWSAAASTSVERFKFFRLAWDYLGCELATRHSQYERFYAGPQFVNALYNFANCRWSDRTAVIDAIMDGTDVPGPEISSGAAE